MNWKNGFLWEFTGLDEKFIIRIYYYGDCPVENLNLYVVKYAGSGKSFSGTRSGTVLTLKFAVISTHAETILREKIEINASQYYFL